ncbi:MAG: pseudaminic acid cytidylyltransferase [Candidatus Magasanikbacteria bacterium RIFOXYC12_FULL_33_11]|uniref:Pseudaminic acid cytidylyltransferase n=1 Tax=Candidatus Magasanikbacteria bacterium RIFOXYC12_FULL_33_11 TaxID=1798701 RepID=A0A1F6NLX1_9BACT|nr:MAG: pseudaminic acid cytidylyltransferase [Candidatus Magasanikbacteria bacterium RIFOXYC12_FULL_33_11]
MSNIAIITARGGSKRIPKKNIRSFLGKPIIAYSIEVALKSGIFDEVMVSTDSEEIADIAISYGAKVPFFRSEKNSDDYSTTSDVIEEVLLKYKELGKEFQYFCCLYSTAPFVTIEKIKEAFDMLKSNIFDAVFPVVKFGYAIQRALKIDDNFIKMIYPENIDKRSQDLSPAYHDCGQFYFMKTDVFLKQKKMFVEKSAALIMGEMETQDIDNEDDWKIAELKYKILNRIT